MRLSDQALADLMRAVLAKGRPFRFRASGWSMLPFIRDGDVLTVAPLAGPAPRLGEVVAFVRPRTRKLVVHRIIGRRGATSIIQGDSVPDHRDGPVSDGDMIGRVTRVERNGRRVRFGLGPERLVVAWMSRLGLLAPLCRLFQPLPEVPSGRSPV